MAIVAENALSGSLQTKADSLKNLIDTYTGDNEEKVFLLNEYARQCFYEMEILKGLNATAEARDLSEKLEFEGGRIMYYLTLSVYFESGWMHEYYQKQAQWLSLQSDSKSASFYEEPDIPDNYWGEDYAGLLEKFSGILTVFEHSGDPELQAVVLWQIANLNYTLNNREPLFAIYDEITELYTLLDQMYPVFLVSTYKMNGLTSLGRIDEAKKIELDLIEFIARNKNDNAIGLITSTMATGFANEGRQALAIEYYIKSIEAFDRHEDLEMRAETYRLMGIAYENLGMDSKASESYANYLSVIETLNDSSRLYLAYDIMVSPLIALKNYEEARKYMELALQDTLSGDKIYLMARYNDAQGQILRDQGNYEEAILYFKKAFEGFIQNTNSNSRWGAPFMPLYIAGCYLKLGEFEQALEFARQCLQLENDLRGVRTGIKSDVSLLLSEIYEQLGNREKAYEYLKIHQQIRSESDRLDEANRIADAEIRAIIDRSQEEIEQLELESYQTAQENRIQRLWIFSISGALISLIILSIVLYRNNKHKLKANRLLKLQKERIQETLEKLETTQSQLIQSEKMASLGELTAGIAHEIQNPLNFVNNFSEVNVELLNELKEGPLTKLPVSEKKEAQDIVENLDQNLEKISFHGKRADSIVKNMLLHSRSNVGTIESTDINALADEYLRLSYHGMRARDKSFNAKFSLNPDLNLPEIKVITQDMGKVFLNIMNNAFYAVLKRSKDANHDYIPKVVVSTRKCNDGIEIRVKDNGQGIPEQVRDKIFQPFFTTKPTGQGTGLGLSLSYDIIKAHGGDISVDTQTGEFTEFLIRLPVNQRS